MIKKSKKNDDAGNTNLEIGLGSILNGFGKLINKLGELADKGEGFSKTGEFDLGMEKKVKGIYGFSIKTGIGNKDIKVEPFGNIHKDETTGEAFVQEVREPMVDVFEEEDRVVVLAEMPGISDTDLQIDLKEDILTLHAENKDKKYHKEVLLKDTLSKENMTIACNNGIVEIQFTKGKS